MVPHQIEALKNRLEIINQIRIDRALTLMGSALRRVYHLLPVLLHYHHPQLPGYLKGNVPHGISLFEPDDTQKRYLHRLIGFGKTTECVLDPLPKNLRPIAGLYCMGSTSSIAQNSASDLDVWVCHDATLTHEERQLLQKKCDLIQKWCVSMGAEVQFFLVDENRFRCNRSGILNSQDCGTTQHILLLDEFYRTAIRMVGKGILWHLVPIEAETDYENYVQALHNEDRTLADHWLDLGGLDALSAEEYFGASLWQLHKSIESPYKAVLKVLLLETYAAEYPQTRLLAIETKKRMQSDNPNFSQLDPYCMMLEKVTRYLIKIKDFARLDLVRCCFYLKVGEKLSSRFSRPEQQWRQELLTQLVQSWRWDKSTLFLLDGRLDWKIDQVRKIHNELMNAMMQSYDQLNRFARRHLNFSASSRDIIFLMRKLYATFAPFPGKVLLLNRQLSADLSEADLTFIYVPPNHTNAQGWYLYNRAPNINEMTSHQPLEHHLYLTKLVAWAWLNGLLTPQTRLHVRNHPLCDHKRVGALVADVFSHFPLRAKSPTTAALCRPSEVCHLTVLINVEYEAKTTTILNMKQKSQPSLVNPFSLIKSIDLLYRTSWDEVQTLHFHGEETIPSALKAIINRVHRGVVKPNKIHVFCYSDFMREALTFSLSQLVSECLDLHLSSSENKTNKVKFLRIGEKVWEILFEPMAMIIRQWKSAADFYITLSHIKRQNYSQKLEKGDTYLPPVIHRYASKGIMQCFFKDALDNHGFNLYMVDETNCIQVFRYYEGNKENLVRELSASYSFSSQEKENKSRNPKKIHFNLPQFYHIVETQEKSQVLPFHHKSVLATPVSN